MPAIRTMTALGAALGQQIPALARSARGKLTVAPVASGEEAARALETLLDRVCLSLTLARPIGLTAWALREAPHAGRAALLDMVRAACDAIASAACGHAVDHHRLVAFLDELSLDVERAVLEVETEDQVRRGDNASEALLAALAERDVQTGCHSKATAAWAKRLALALDCEPQTADFIALCALLHDVGKMATPDRVLLKPAPLTATEWDVMRDHAAAGARILDCVPDLRGCAIVVRAHHERFDGTGYPDGLAGSAIPFEARVVAVADAFHAMISDRPYREALAPRRALECLREGRGTQWDPRAVDAMLSMFDRRTSIASHARQVSSA